MDIPHNKYKQALLQLVQEIIVDGREKQISKDITDGQDFQFINNVINCLALNTMLDEGISPDLFPEDFSLKLSSIDQLRLAKELNLLIKKKMSLVAEKTPCKNASAATLLHFISQTVQEMKTLIVQNHDFEELLGSSMRNTFRIQHKAYSLLTKAQEKYRLPMGRRIANFHADSLSVKVELLHAQLQQSYEELRWKSLARGECLEHTQSLRRSVQQKKTKLLQKIGEVKAHLAEYYAASEKDPEYKVLVEQYGRLVKVASTRRHVLGQIGNPMTSE